MLVPSAKYGVESIAADRVSDESAWSTIGALLNILDEVSEIRRSERFAPVAGVSRPLEFIDDVAVPLQTGTTPIKCGSGFHIDPIFSGWNVTDVGTEAGDDGTLANPLRQHIEWVH